MEQDTHLPKGLEHLAKITADAHEAFKAIPAASLPKELEGFADKLEAIRELSHKLLVDLDWLEYAAKRLRKGS